MYSLPGHSLSLDTISAVAIIGAKRQIGLCPPCQDHLAGGAGRGAPPAAQGRHP